MEILRRRRPAKRAGTDPIYIAGRPGEGKGATKLAPRAGRTSNTNVDGYSFIDASVLKFDRRCSG